MSVLSREMSELSSEDIHDIHRVLRLHGYLVDDRTWDRMGEVFTDDVVFDNPDGIQASDLKTLIAEFKVYSKAGNSHNLTNVILSEATANSVAARSKAITFYGGGRIGVFEYFDELRRTPVGWRVSARRLVRLEA